jgi:hypothetical protein
MILLAGMNRGWEINHHLNFLRGILWTVGVWLEDAVSMLVRRQPTILAVRRGGNIHYSTTHSVAFNAVQARSENESYG